MVSKMEDQREDRWVPGLLWDPVAGAFHGTTVWLRPFGVSAELTHASSSEAPSSPLAHAWIAAQSAECCLVLWERPLLSLCSPSAVLA